LAKKYRKIATLSVIEASYFYDLPQFSIEQPILTIETLDSRISMILTRVTRLGEFSPIGQLFTLGSFLNIISSPNFGLLFSTEKVMKY
jgi:hypothetical protein